MTHPEHVHVGEWCEACRAAARAEVAPTEWSTECWWCSDHESSHSASWLMEQHLRQREEAEGRDPTPRLVAAVMSRTPTNRPPTTTAPPPPAGPAGEHPRLDPEQVAYDKGWMAGVLFERKAAAAARAEVARQVRELSGFESCGGFGCADERIQDFAAVLALLEQPPEVRQPERRKRIDWSNVVIDEGDEAP